MDPASELTESTVDQMAKPSLEPVFLVKLDPWHRAFLRNLVDLLWTKEQPALKLSSQPEPFWSDVFVTSRLPWGGLLESALYHVAAFVSLWLLAQFWPQPPRILDRPVFARPEVVSYSPSEYLPPIDTGDRNIQLPQLGEPEYAPQPIISVPPEPDNKTQTIVTPPEIRLNRDVPLPNIVAWSETPPAVPLGATARALADKPPTLPSSVIAPPPDVTRIAPHQALAPPQSVVAPPPDVNSASTLRILQAPQPAIIEPSPAVESVSTRKWGEMNIGHTNVVAPAPQLPLAEQRALAGATRGSLGSAGGAVVPPPPSIPGIGSSQSGGRLIALGIHPAVLRAPIEAPAGNRRGTFAATPGGKAGAPGTPDIASSPNQGDGGGSSDRTKGAPPGIYVGANPGLTAHAAGAGQVPKNGTGSSTPPPSEGARLLADATPPRVTAVPRHSAAEVPDHVPTEIEKQVFGDRKFYSMTLNMPNLNSAGGSWIIQFAELHEEGDKGELVAPQATQKVDPAYPLELMRRGVQGTVTLYAVIHRDGSVGQVRVLRAVNDRLDEYARTALSRWHFLPATKNGTAVDLEAVVVIPFRALPMKTGF